MYHRRIKGILANFADMLVMLSPIGLYLKSGFQLAKFQLRYTLALAVSLGFNGCLHFSNHLGHLLSLGVSSIC